MRNNLHFCSPKHYAIKNNRKKVFKKFVLSKFPIFDLFPILFVPIRFTCTPSPSTYFRFSESPLAPLRLSKRLPRRLWVFKLKIREWKERKELFFLSTQHKRLILGIDRLDPPLPLFVFIFLRPPPPPPPQSFVANIVKCFYRKEGLYTTASFKPS